ncbi:MAG: hypothetical protein GF398_20175 [Chitinivibrionales bacterium]|nr:hypothetical protein [Chitinivibrionales bacterium]
MIAPNRNLSLPAVITISLILMAHADQIATTKGGRQVVLKDNGTWKYATRRDLAVQKQIAPSGPAQSPSPRQNQLSLPGGQAGSGRSAADEQRPGSPAGTGRAGTSGPTKLPARKKTSRPSQATGKQSAQPKPSVSLIEVVESNKNFEFRKAHWGATKGQVKSSEKAQLLHESADQLEYKHSLAGINCKVIYKFDNGKLSRGFYKIEQDHVDPNMFYADFESLVSYLSKIYGTPRARNFDWKNPMYKNDKSKWGFAISIGFLKCNVIWQFKNTKVDLNISGGKHSFNTMIEYSAGK